jgi:L-ascorbate metabolism protein UlaG (beta-lactamase superfamily)
LKIKYLGHSCFLITSGAGIRIITDPFHKEEDLEHGEINETADIVTMSHNHYDHNNFAAVRGSPAVVRGTASVKGIEFKGIPAYHDESGGRLRGAITILCFEVDGIRLCHLGDLGHELTPEQLGQLGRVDVLFIPVGGYFTIDGKLATSVYKQVKAAVTIPMHWNDKWAVRQVASVERFLEGKDHVRRVEGSEIELKPGELPSEIIVLRSAL